MEGLVSPGRMEGKIGSLTGVVGIEVLASDFLGAEEADKDDAGMAAAAWAGMVVGGGAWLFRAERRACLKSSTRSKASSCSFWRRFL